MASELADGQFADAAAGRAPRQSIDAPNEYDLTVAYRIYPLVSKTPVVFADDKLKLAELCLKSFRDSLQSLRVRLVALLDGCPPEYTALFKKYFAETDLDFIALPGLGNRATFYRQIQVLLTQSYSELVYFAEDDYFYFPGQFASMVRLMRANSDVHFITPYDHLDYYNNALHAYPRRVITWENREWRTVASTCLTFLTTKSILRRTAPVFRSYARKNRDSSMWFSLTKLRIRNPLTALSVWAYHRPSLSVMAHAWYHSWREILFGKEWNLWAPVPTIATHLESEFLAPHYDWQNVLAEEVKLLR